MTALVLGMLVSTANSSYQDRKSELAEMSSNFVLVDGLLASYGPETQGIFRMELRGLAESGLERIWPSHAAQVSQLRPTDNGQSFYNRLQILAPKNEAQAAVKGSLSPLPSTYRRTYSLSVLGNGAELPLISFTGGCGFVADLHLHQLRSVRAAHQDNIGNTGSLRARRFLCRVHYYGDVHAVQRSDEDFLFSHLGSIEPDGSLNAW